MTFPISLEQFSTNFGMYPVPPLLEALLTFENASQEWYSLAFELDVIPQAVLRHHLKEEAISHCYCFGHDGNDSLYALWRYTAMPLDEAPVVYLNSEGHGSGVLAPNLAAFVSLLAYGTEPIFGVYPGQAEADDARTYAPRNAEFRLWLASHFHLQAAASPNEVVKQAQQHFPSLPLVVPLD